MACGLPSIIVDYGGPRDLIDENSGILLPMQPKAPMVESLRSSMERVVREPDLCKRLAGNALDRIRAEFTWDKKAEKLTAIYRETLQPSP